MGTIFKVTTAGDFTSLVSFTGTSGAVPGSSPSGNLVFGGDGNLYGTTRLGGAGNLGTIFKITPAGVLTTPGQLHRLHRRHARLAPDRRADRGQRRQLLRHHHHRRREQSRLDLPALARRRLHLARELHRHERRDARLEPPRRAAPGARRQSLWHDANRRLRRRLRDDLQAHPGGRAHDADQFHGDQRGQSGQLSDGKSRRAQRTARSMASPSPAALATAARLSSSPPMACSPRSSICTPRPAIGKLAQASDGRFFGTTTGGGFGFNSGTVFAGQPADAIDVARAARSAVAEYAGQCARRFGQGGGRLVLGLHRRRWLVESRLRLQDHAGGRAHHGPELHRHERSQSRLQPVPAHPRRGWQLLGHDQRRRQRRFRARSSRSRRRACSAWSSTSPAQAARIPGPHRRGR